MVRGLPMPGWPGVLEVTVKVSYLSISVCANLNFVQWAKAGREWMQTPETVIPPATVHRLTSVRVTHRPAPLSRVDRPRNLPSPGDVI
jgi:hypothetical protein